MASSPFYDAGTIARLATNLFHGWGYDFYKVENNLRADDLMIRARVCEILGAVRAVVATAEAGYRREFLPAPTRERPRPASEALSGARILERIGQELGALEGQIRALPVPEGDRMTERFRRERDTLARLAEADQGMVGHAEFLRSLLAPASGVAMDGVWMIANDREIGGCIGAIRSAIQARCDLLGF